MRKTFDETGDFKSFYVAEAWLKENGYSIGSMERDYPIGIAKGNVYISKWNNLGSDKEALDGMIADGDKRNGPVTVIIFDEGDTNPYFRE